MADIIVQNAIGKVTEAINSGASGINYSGVFGKSLIDKVKEVMEAYSTSGVYTVGSACLLYTSPSPRDVEESRMPSSA